MKPQPNCVEAYRLLHEGTLALARVERAGMRVDVPLLERTINQVSKRMCQLSERLKSDPLWKGWRRIFGNQATLGSRQQLAEMLRRQGIDTGQRTPSGRMRMSESALESVDLPFVRDYLRLEKLRKLHSTYLLGIRREITNSKLHPFFNLHLVRSYRSSSDHPNFQNLPIRDKVMGQLIRRCFVPRPGHVLVEIDYKALEVRIAACYHRDPRMLAYIRDPKRDMHRDMAAQCYRLAPADVTSDMRFAAKSGFVFPQFYGDYYVRCAASLWKFAADLKLPNGTPMYAHLRSVGLSSYESFESHIADVEAVFWGKMFPRYDLWRRRWWEKYQRTGEFRMFTGFAVRGVYGRNDVINYPVQGSAFHCLLWSLIQLVGWLERKKMRTVIVGQIHDSLVADVHKDELSDFLAKAKQVMTIDVRRHWPWIIVPLEIEAEVGKDNWYDKKPINV